MFITFRPIGLLFFMQTPQPSAMSATPLTFYGGLIIIIIIIKQTFRPPRPILSAD